MYKPKKARFNHPCNYPGCRNLTKYRFCEEHTQEADAHRASAHKRGYDARWQRYRVSFLANNPLCAECLRRGNTTLANVVDHIKPHKGSYRLFWEVKNHEALCKVCHDRKTASEDMGGWNTHKGLR